MELPTATIAGKEIEEGGIINRRSDVYPNAFKRDESPSQFPEMDDSEASWNSMEVKGVIQAGKQVNFSEYPQEDSLIITDLRSQIRFEVPVSFLEKYHTAGLIGIASTSR